jgi:biopolymer transport protein ExbD
MRLTRANHRSRIAVLAVALFAPACRSTPAPPSSVDAHATPSSGAPSSTAIAPPAPSGTPAPRPSTATSQPADPDGLVVLASKSKLLAGDTELAELPPPAQAASSGMDDKYKEPGRPFVIVPLLKAAQAYHDKAVATLGEDAAMNAIVIAEPATPYRLVVEILFTLGQAGLAKYHLMILQSSKAPSARDATPSLSPLPPIAMHGSTETLDLKLRIGDDGVSFSTKAGPVGAGCKRNAPGVAAPKRGAAHDLMAVRRCAQRIKSEASEETAITITATGATRYETVILTMDAVRTDGNVELFPSVNFGPPL